MRNISEILQVTDYQELDNDEIQALIDYRSEQAAKRAVHEALEGERRAAMQEIRTIAAQNAATLSALSQTYTPPVLEVVSYG